MANSLKFVFISLTLALLAAIVVCSLAPSPNMREMWWIPDWVGDWADRNGNFRNFPVFAAFAALLFFVVTFYQVGRRGDLSRKASVLVTRYSRWRLAFGAFLATALLGVALEVLQLLFLSNRHFDWADIGWSTSGALVGATVAAACMLLSRPRLLSSASSMLTALTLVS